MTQLSEQRCEPCEGGVKPFTTDQARQEMGSLHQEWTLSQDGKSVHRAFGFKNFYRTMSFVNAVAHIANTEDHHPDLEVGYNYCRMKFSTHAIDGLSRNDFICAAKVDRLPL